MKTNNLKGKKSLRFYFSVILFIVILLVSVTATYSYNSNLNSIRNNILEYDNRLAQNVTEKINYFLSAEEIFFNSYITNQEVISYISNNYNKNEEEQFRSISRVTHNYMAINPEIYDIILLNKSEEYSSFYSPENVIKQVIPIAKTKGNISVFSNNNILFAVARDVHDVNSPKVIGTCIFLIYGSVFSNVIGNDMQTGYSRFYVISSDMLLLCEPQKTPTEELAYVASIALNKNASDQSVDYINGHKFLIRRSIINGYGFNIVSTLPLDELYKSIPSTSIGFVLMLVLSVLLIFAILILFFYKIEKSFDSLLHHMKNIKEGDFDDRAQPVFGLEMSQITDEFNSMMNNIVSLTNENSNYQKEMYEAEILSKATKLQILQSQMNPHFINNTLTCIKSIALYYSVSEISEMCSAMAKILKYSKSDNLTTTVGRELEMITSYLYIQSIRFVDKFEVKLDIDESLKNLKMLRFILQPIVENSITHGLEPKSGRGTLTVTGYHEGNEIIFEINDNGVGIQPQKFKLITQSLANNTISSIEDSISTGWGIGMVNIHNRIQLYYGKKYSLTVSTEVGIGTSVVIRIPDNINL